MNILIIYRHYWPDTPPYASMLKTMAEGFSEKGHQVTIITEQPCHKTNADKVFGEGDNSLTIIRLNKLPFYNKSGLLRNIDTAAFPARSLLHGFMLRARNRKFDYVISATIPPVISGFFGALTSKLFGAKFIYHVQDIYPEIAESSGMIKRNSVIYKTLGMLEQKTTNWMHQAVTLSDDMKNTMTARGVRPEKISVINNFMLESFDENNPKEQKKRTKIRVIFAGNIGRFQGLGLFVDAFLKSNENDMFELVFLGDGQDLENLKKKAGGHASISFLPRVGYEEAKEEIRNSDLGIVSIDKKIECLAYPSKIMTYLGLGVPLLTTISKESEIGAFISTSNIGLCVNRDPDEIVKAMRELTANRDSIETMKKHCTEIFDTYFRPAVSLNKWDTIINQKCNNDH